MRDKMGRLKLCILFTGHGVTLGAIHLGIQNCSSQFFYSLIGVCIAWALMGVFAAQVALLSAWSATSASPLFVRIPLLFMAIILLSYAYPIISSINVACGWWMTYMYEGHPPPSRYMDWTIALGCLAISVFIPLMIARYIRPKDAATDGASSRYQFTIVDVFAWTTSVSVMLAVGVILVQLGWTLDVAILIFQDKVTIAPFLFGGLAVALIVSVGRICQTRVVLLSCCLPLAVSVVDWRYINSFPGDDIGTFSWAAYASMYLTFEVVLLASLFCLGRFRPLICLAR